MTYDIAYYYDAGADGLLSYINPTQVIDGDFGEGIDDIYFDLLCGTMYGIEVSYTTNNYQRNRVVCADTVHYVRSVFIPTPFAEQPFYDPYRLSQIEPKRKENAISLMIPENPSEFYSAGEVTIVAYSYACIRTPTVASVEFQTINSDVTTDNPASLGGGQRVFPDRQTPNDGVNRRIVRVRAQLASSGGSPTFTSGARVYFRNFDVDDPSDDPIIDPMGNLGNDNRGTPQAGTLNLPSATTDSNGIATVEFTTTMQPGDNFVIAASTDPNYLNGSGVVVNGTGLQDSAGNQLPTTRGKRTDMLSVWRRLHIEVDSMGQAQDNVAVGNTQTGGTLRRYADVVIPVNVSSDLEVNRFQNGRLVFVGGNPYHRIRIVSNTARSVTVRNIGNYATVSYIATNQFQLYDDDDFNGDDGPLPGDNTLDGDIGEEVESRTETFAAMRDNDNDLDCFDQDCNIFGAAYITPEYVWAQGNGYNQTNIQFDLNVETVTVTDVDDYVSLYRNSGSDERNDFWIAYVLVSYQGNLTRDGDGGPLDANGNVVREGGLGGDSSGIALADDVPTTGPFPIGGQASVVYLEACRDNEINNIATSVPPEWNAGTVPHEVGHQLGLNGDVPNIFGIMSSTGATFNFVPRHINMLRTRVNSPGQ